MLNRYPLWKYLVILLVLVVGIIYALPNIYTNDPAVQVAGSRSAAITDATRTQIENTLKDAGITPKSVEFHDASILVRFNNEEDQLNANELMKSALGSDYTVALNLAQTTPKWLRALNANPMYLGLDLRGGLHFLIEIDMETAMRQEMERYRTDFRDLLRKNRDKDVRALSVVARKDHVELKFKTEARRDNALKLLQREYRDMQLTYLEEQRGDAFYITVSHSQASLESFRSNTISQIITVLKKRVDDKYQGLVEPVIVRQGDSRIVAEFPGVQNSAEMLSILTATASLEYRMQHTENTVAEAKAGHVPGTRIYKMRGTGEEVLLKNRIIITGKEITHASSGFDDNGLPAVHVTLNSVGAKKMGETTKKNLKKPMAVVFIEYETKKVVKDGKEVLVSVPVEEVISIATIQGVFSKNFQTTGLDADEAPRLALLLRAGALAAPIQIVEERTVGPALGKENIEKGLDSVLIGFIAVVAFMFIWYRGFGVLANIALFVNLILIVALLSLLQATLTLPGIAGIVLTVGMAVDANVLIFERIREELRVGNTPQSSINAGYEKAFSTIFDANITTLIAAVVLYVFGTGPIKGFATTLSLGIATSMFTAIMGTRAIVNLMVGGKKIKKLSI